MGQVKKSKSKTSKEFWKLGINDRNASGRVGNWAQVTPEKQKDFNILNLIDEKEINKQIQEVKLKEDEYIEVVLDVNVRIKKQEGTGLKKLVCC